MAATRALDIGPTTIYPADEQGEKKSSLVISQVTQTSIGEQVLPVIEQGVEISIPTTGTSINAIPFVTVSGGASASPSRQLAIPSGSMLPTTSLMTPSSSTQVNSTTRSTSKSTTSSAPSRTSSIAGSSNQTSSRTTQQHNSNSNSISPGAAAGIGIGCAIAGALIAAAILALLFRRRKRHDPTRSDAIPLNGFASVDKTAISSPDLSSSPAGFIERNLPQPVEDQALGGELSRLGTAIKNHVQSYYHTNNIVGSVDQAALGVIAAGNMPLIASTLASLLTNPTTRLTAIRFCIAWVAISRIDPSCEPSRSFLPPEIAGCLVSIAGAREDPSTRMAFLSRWRAITASLLQSKYGGGNFGSYDPRNQNLSEALQALDTVLSPFMTEKRDERARTQNLEEILKRGARFGFLLFSQPSTWELDWNAPPNEGRGVLAISPALVQIGDDNGRRLPRPRTVEEQDLARGLESYL